MDFEKYILNDKDEIVNNLIELIKIKSVYTNTVEDIKSNNINAPFGLGNRKALDFVLNLCNKLGFETVDLDGYSGYAQIGSGNKLIAILTHLDVVPEGSGWDYPPYLGMLKNEKIIGRGAYDNKGPVISAIYALKAIIDSGVPIKSRVRVYFGCDEETGFRCIYNYIKNHEIPTYSLVPDSRFPVTNFEKGILYFDVSTKLSFNDDFKLNSIRGSDAPNIVPGICEIGIEISDKLKDKILAYTEDFLKNTNQLVRAEILSHNLEDKNNVLLTSYGRQCHASTPELGINAVGIMMEFLKSINMAENSNLFENFSSFIEFYCDLIGKTYYGENLLIENKCEKTGYITMNAGKFLLSEDNLSLKFDIRYPLNVDGSKIITQISKFTTRYKLEINNVDDIPPMYVPEDSFIVKTLVEVYRDICKTDEKPVSVGFSTYAHAITNAVGFGPFFPNEKLISHEANEAISVETLLKCTNLNSEALLRLSLGE